MLCRSFCLTLSPMVFYNWNTFFFSLSVSFVILTELNAPLLARQSPCVGSVLSPRSCAALPWDRVWPPPLKFALHPLFLKWALQYRYVRMEFPPFPVPLQSLHRNVCRCLTSMLRLPLTPLRSTAPVQFHVPSSSHPQPKWNSQLSIPGRDRPIRSCPPFPSAAGCPAALFG